jgi:ketosteroid isomerase-like protein
MSSHGTESANARREIETLYAEYRGAVEASSLAGYLRVLHPEVRLLPPGAPAIDTAQRYGEFLAGVFGAATYRVEVLRAPEVRVFGDVAIAEYDYTIHLARKDPAVGVTEPGALTEAATTSRYLDVLRRGADGAWRIWRHSWQPLAS